MQTNRLNSIKELQLKANDISQDIINMLLTAKSGHSAGPLGMADIFTALYFHTAKHDAKKPDWTERDRIILSNGHICPVLYATLAEAGYFDKKLLSTLRKLNSPLQGHPHMGSLSGIETSSGPLGQGLSQACGMALAARMDKRAPVYWVLMGDGEQDEGQCWEAFMLAAKYKLGNIIAITDRNIIQIDGTTESVMPLEPLADKYRAFGWRVVEIDGNDMTAVVKALDEARTYAAANTQAAPTMILANTVPGKGVSFMEGKYQWHGKTPNAEEAAIALKEMQEERERIKSDE
ncbi:1-deoxy-D-xylulose-5-phosphate synthase [uncultured archaeon]|nr:1-deoxy-D-xylulose-5-phosphate synthase [uncultured archaeon]